MNTIQEFIATNNLDGILIGLLTFLIIGVFHPLVIKGEYYLGQKSNWLFLAGGILTFALSISTHGTISIILGVTSFSCFWSILEVREQRERVKKGWFPANPRRKENSKDITELSDDE
ncbi:MAG: DUF4491 family protein [Bacteroidales bacterium]|nr:DUF4491 family protein [Bacteroidales bacterium]MBD5222776.1 DUF4491 family protein [Bacteroidales bacterium]MBD5303097.1 DUF4491 family protein [Bacteroides sp.]